MDAIIVFSPNNEHPLRWILDKTHRHVWCSVRLDNYWVTYDWYHGIPLISVAQSSDFDLAKFYRDAGYEVIKTTVGEEPCHGPWMCNNCVGHTMVICGIRTHFIFTPHQLWKHITGAETMTSRIKKFFTSLEFVPGFGGASAAPPPVYQAPVSPRSEMAIAADKTLSDEEAARVKAQKKAAGTVSSTGGTLLDDAEDGSASASSSSMGY